MQQHVISEGREEKEKEKGNTEGFRITRGAVMCGRAKLYLKDRGDGRGPYVCWFGDEGAFVLGQQGRIIPH